MVAVLERALPARRPPTSMTSRTMADLLLKVAQSRDIEAFRKLYDLYGPRVKAYMMRQGADATTAEDLAQETLMVVWRKAELYSDEKGSATTWIFTIARNLRIDRLRREVAWQPLPENRDEEPSNDPDPETELSHRQRREKVQAAMAALPQDQSEVVVLSYIEGLSHSEIAERLGLPLGTVKSRMRLAYQKIKEAIGDDV